jgi:hypothetical protein
MRVNDEEKAMLAGELGEPGVLLLSHRKTVCMPP